MRFAWIVCALAALSSLAASRAEETETVIKLTVDATPAPKPSLKYTLLPELMDMQPGNAIPAWYKCFMEQNHLYHDKKVLEDREKWLKCPLSEMPAKDLKNYGGASVKQAHYAARLDQCDWQLLIPLRSEGVSLLLPDIQQLRSLAAVLKVRYRAELADGKFNDAVRTHQTMFALARHLGEHPTLIGSLVGMSIAGITIGPFEEMIQQPEAPNFYWALSQLPTPFLDLRKAIQGERLFVGAEFRGLEKPDRVWGPDEIADLDRRMPVLIGLIENEPKKQTDELRDWVRERLKDEKYLTAARQRLIEAGLPKAAVDRYPAEQVIFQIWKLRFDEVRDDFSRWMAFPLWQADPPMKKMEDQQSKNVEDRLAWSLVAAYRKVRHAQARTDQRLAMLRVVEALRLYAAGHGGKLPAKLSDVETPLPLDPITGKDFVYRLDGGTGILRNTPSVGRERDTAYNIRYEITIRK